MSEQSHQQNHQQVHDQSHNQYHEQIHKNHQCFLGLGSNLTNEIGTPTEHINTAIASLQKHPKIDNAHSSSLYISEPYGVTDQPDFINAVVGLKTELSPHELLVFCQSLETAAKRERLRHWGERSLDVDILLYGDEIVQTDNLTIPHIELSKRNFVLVPLVEVATKLNIKLYIKDANLQNTALIDIPMSQDWTGLCKADF